MPLWYRDSLTLGSIAPLPFMPKVRLSKQARTGHVYVVGKTGKGKSKFLQSCLYQDILAGRGCGVIDPHADLIGDLLGLLSEKAATTPKLIERIVYLNPADHSHTIPFNVLATQGAAYEVAQNVIEAFRRTWPESLGEAPHFSNVMLHSLLVLIRARRTLLDLPRLLTDQGFRDDLLVQIADTNLTEFFHTRFDAWGKHAATMKESTLNKVTAITMNPHLVRMLGHSHNALDFGQIMDEGKVLLADLGHCDEESQRLIGNLITTGIEQAAFARHTLPHHQRRPFYLYIDEFQDFSASSGSTKTLSKILSGARKFGLHLILAHQNLSQLSARMQGAVIGNVWTKVIFGVSEEDAYTFARYVGLGNFNTEAIKHEAQTDTQHPVYSPLSEQEHQWAVQLANQRPRRATVRTHNGRTKRMWTLTLPQSTQSRADALKQQLSRQFQQIASPPPTTTAPLTRVLPPAFG